MTTSQSNDLLAAAAGMDTPATYAWTQEQVVHSLEYSTVADVATGIRELLDAQDLVVDDPEDFATSCATALASGHLVLQGPPGTGKTTIVRVLAEAFGAELMSSTATADWSTFDVIGGLRPTESGALAPHLGCVADAVLRCAEGIRSSPSQPVWLMIDEMNRADIDKAFGQLFTVLSSTSADHLERSPIDLWFESRERRELWVPRQFRIIATINDVDASFVNTFSQGLSRRFQFVSLGVSTDAASVQAEIAATYAQARSWFVEERGAQAEDVPSDAPDAVVTILLGLFTALRNFDSVNWPVGSAQILDLWKAVLLATNGAGDDGAQAAALERAIRDRLVPQATNLDDERLGRLLGIFAEDGPVPMDGAWKAVRHLRNSASTF